LVALIDGGANVAHIAAFGWGFAVASWHLGVLTLRGYWLALKVFATSAAAS
jgi:hypothetical protein